MVSPFKQPDTSRFRKRRGLPPNLRRMSFFVQELRLLAGLNTRAGVGFSLSAALPKESMRQFECCECGMQVSRLHSGKPPVPPLCAICLHLPGWPSDPLLRAYFGGFDIVTELRPPFRARVLPGRKGGSA